jgi:hypothetical protein
VAALTGNLLLADADSPMAAATKAIAAGTMLAMPTGTMISNAVETSHACAG